jgi:myo-inositol-1(or 4)-monophosphatase
MQHFLALCEKAARAGGEVLLEHQHRVVGREKGRNDLVSEADLASQRRIQEVIRAEFADHAFLGEEDDPTAPAANESEHRWIVDPLDGTMNYLHGLPMWAVVVAVERRGDLLAGVVYDPVLDECFSAHKGGGAFLNGRPLRTSVCQSPESALVAASFSPVVVAKSLEVQRFVVALQSCQGVRRLGSAALNLAYVAAGRLDAYWATAVKIWDICSGVLLVREASGVVTHIEGGELDLNRPELLASATRALHERLLQVLHGR